MANGLSGDTGSGFFSSYKILVSSLRLFACVCFVLFLLSFFPSCYLLEELVMLFRIESWHKFGEAAAMLATNTARLRTKGDFFFGYQKLRNSLTVCPCTNGWTLHTGLTMGVLSLPPTSTKGIRHKWWRCLKELNFKTTISQWWIIFLI